MTASAPLIPTADNLNTAAARGEHGSFLTRYVFSTDHKIIGIQFLFSSLAFFALGGLLAMLMRWQLAWPNDPRHPVPILGRLMGWGGGTMPADFYNVVLSMHSTIMVFFVVIPMLVGAFGNYLIPLKIGARDMAFPFLNGLAFWLSLPAGAILIDGFFLNGGPAAGWTSYPPLSAIAVESAHWPAIPLVITTIAFFMTFAYVGTHHLRLGNLIVDRLLTIALSLAAAIFVVRGIQHVAFDGQACWFLSLFVLGFSNLLGAINYLATIARLRCAGMMMFRLPLSVWSLFITAMMVLLATPVLSADLLLNLLDHQTIHVFGTARRLTSFFEPTGWMVSQRPVNVEGGGYPLLHPHLFWFYSHPAVYIMILPAMGMVSDILSCFARKPIFGYRAMIYALAAIAFLGFVVWGHHMFQSGMNPSLGTTFAISTMVIAVPSGIKTFNWLATLKGGNIRFTVPLLFAAAFVSLFVIGGLSGIFLASTPVDVHFHMTYFVVAHIHYVLFGASTFGIFAAIYFWYPKMFGRMMNDTLGYLHFAVTFIAFNCTFFTMHILGLQGMPRRVADYTQYQTFRHLQPMNQFISISAFVLGIGQMPFIINFIGSWIWGKQAPANPWQATTLEWDTTSPPPPNNFGVLPVVHRGAYEYSSPLSEEDWLPQSKEMKD